MAIFIMSSKMNTSPDLFCQLGESPSEITFLEYVPAIQIIICNDPSLRLCGRLPITFHILIPSAKQITVALATIDETSAKKNYRVFLQQNLNNTYPLNKFDLIHNKVFE